MADAETDHNRGRRLGGRYLLDDKLGQGGMGVVYAATDERLTRRVAVKLLRDTVNDADARRRFDSEAHRTARLEHPNIVRVYDSGSEPDGTPYIVMEHLHGCPLRQLGQLDWRSSLDIIRQVTLALTCAHTADPGVIHRDIKPGNIFLLDDETVKVLDFGLAREIVTSHDTNTGILTGTLAYLSPEQVMGQRATARSDLYALGVVWREMLTGKNVFKCETDLLTQLAVRDTVAPAVSTEIPDVDARVDALIERLLMKDPAARPKTAAEVTDAVLQIAGSAGIAPPLPRPREPATQPLPPRPSPSSRSLPPPLLSIGPRLVITALLVVAALFLGWGLLPKDPPPEPAHVDDLKAGAISALQKPGDEPAPLVALGRRMFHDPRLSGNGIVSCATCHPLASGGTTAEPQTHLGVSGEPANFNTSSMWNAALMYRYSWRADAPLLADIVERAISKPELMGNGTVAALTKRLGGNSDYPERFKDAGLSFDREGIARAFNAYFKHIVPSKAAADAILDGRTAPTPDYTAGHEQFEKYGCVACHQGRNVGGNMVARFGVMVDDPYADRGQCDDKSFCRSDADCAISGGGRCVLTHVVREVDLGMPPAKQGDPPTYLFRVPSLRNVARTAPYFHDGSARTLSEAIDTMARIQLGRTLPLPERQQIETFLGTLTGEWPVSEQDEIDRVQRELYTEQQQNAQKPAKGTP